MLPSTLALVEIQRQPCQLTDLAAVVHKDRQGIASRLSDHELDAIQGSYVGSTGDRATSYQGADFPPASTVGDVESRLPTPASGGADSTLGFANPSKTRWRVLSACLMNLGGGLNDSAPGALIPYIEKEYGIGYALVSLIFVANALGFILAAPFTHSLETRLGRSKTYAVSMLLLASGYAIIIVNPPFPAVATSFFFLGFGYAINLALNNVFCANLANSTAALGALHGGYGIGGTVGPLIATAMVSHGVRWSFYYCLPLAVAVFNLGFAVWSFYSYEQDLPVQLRTSLEQTASRQQQQQQPLSSGPTTKKQLLMQALRNRVTLTGALLIFAYQGAEVSVSGWVVSFLISYRHGDPSRVGYVSAGFWAGITMGRFLLSHPAHRIGEKLAVVLLLAGSVALQLMTWLIPNVISDAITVAILGLLLGPFYPCATAVFTKLLPRRFQTSSLSFVSAMGSSGGAVSPFLTGLLAQHVGTVVLHPICIGLYGVILASWASLPRIRKRSE